MGNFPQFEDDRKRGTTSSSKFDDIRWSKSSSVSTRPPRGTIPPPTVLASLKNGLQVFSDDLVPLLVMGFVVTAVGGACRSPVLLVENGGVYVSLALTLLVASPFELGMSFICLRAVRSGRVNFEHLIAVIGRYGSMVLASTLMALILSPATATNVSPDVPFFSMSRILMIPAVAFFCATRFVPFLLLEDELRGGEAILESIKLSLGHFWRLVGICVFGLLGIVAIGLLANYVSTISTIGLVPVLVWWNLALASFYHSIARPPEGWALEDQEELDRQNAEAREDDGFESAQ